MLLTWVNRVAQVASIVAAGWWLLGVAQDRQRGPGVLMMVIAVLVLSMVTQLLVNRREDRGPGAAEQLGPGPSD